VPKKRFSSEHIIAKLCQIEVQLAQGKSIALACKGAAISEQSARALVDTPVQAHSRHAASQFAEDRGCSSDKGVHTLSACGGQGEKAAAGHHFIRHGNSHVGCGATIPQVMPLSRSAMVLLLARELSPLLRQHGWTLFLRAIGLKGTFSARRIEDAAGHGQDETVAGLLGFVTQTAHILAENRQQP